MLGPFFIALAAAASNATSNILQRGAHVDVLSERNNEKFSLKLLFNVIRRPRWLVGIVTMVASFILQAIGLAVSSLAVIQPILVLELPLTLIGAGLFLKEQLTSREWLGATMMFCGVLVFIVMLDPSPGTAITSLSTFTGAFGMIITVLIAVAIYLASLRFGQKIKSALLGTASGIGFGLTAIVIKDMTSRISAHGFWPVFSGWQIYLMIVFGILSVYLYQYAINSGRLMYAQPGVTLADPFVAVIWGVAIFNESVRGGFYLVVALIGVGLAAVGVTLLSKSKLLKTE